MLPEPRPAARRPRTRFSTPQVSSTSSEDAAPARSPDSGPWRLALRSSGEFSAIQNTFSKDQQTHSSTMTIMTIPEPGSH